MRWIFFRRRLCFGFVLAMSITAARPDSVDLIITENPDETLTLGGTDAVNWTVEPIEKAAGGEAQWLFHHNLSGLFPLDNSGASQVWVSWIEPENPSNVNYFWFNGPSSAIFRSDGFNDGSIAKVNDGAVYTTGYGYSVQVTDLGDAAVPDTGATVAYAATAAAGLLFLRRFWK